MQPSGITWELVTTDVPVRQRGTIGTSQDFYEVTFIGTGDYSTAFQSGDHKATGPSVYAERQNADAQGEPHWRFEDSQLVLSTYMGDSQEQAKLLCEYHAGHGRWPDETVDANLFRVA